MHRLYTGLTPPKEKGIIHCPFIRTVMKNAKDIDLQHLLHGMEKATHVIFTSQEAVRYFFQLAPFAKKLHVLAVGRATAAFAKKEGAVKIEVATLEQAEGILQLLHPLISKQENIFFLYPHSARSRPLIKSYLEEHFTGRFIAAPLYETELITPNPLPHLAEFASVIFTSPSTVFSFFRCYPTPLPAHLHLETIGPETRKALDKFTELVKNE